MRTYDPQAAATLFQVDGWFKAAASNANGTGCVEINFTDGLVGLRDSKNPEGPTFAFTPHEWHTLLTHLSD